MEIRPTTLADLPRVMELYAHARAYMKAHGNLHQWGDTHWPPEALIREDVRQGHSYVCTKDGQVVGTFFFVSGEDIEPTYREISDGAWRDPSAYGVIHRIASDGSVKGVGAFCIRWAYGRCPHLRVDTHGDNQTMQTLLQRLGFVHCGTIFVEEDDFPRLAYERSERVFSGK